jgi:hypothetical protein
MLFLTWNHRFWPPFLDPIFNSPKSKSSSEFPIGSKSRQAIKINMPIDRAVDPDYLNPDPDPASGESGSGSNPDPNPYPGFW